MKKRYLIPILLVVLIIGIIFGASCSDMATSPQQQPTQQNGWSIQNGSADYEEQIAELEERISDLELRLSQLSARVGKYPPYYDIEYRLRDLERQISDIRRGW